MWNQSYNVRAGDYFLDFIESAEENAKIHNGSLNTAEPENAVTQIDS